MRARHPPPQDPQPRHRVSRKANPLRRRSDQLEAWISRLLLLILLLGLPAATLGTGLATYRSAMGTVRTQSAERQEVDAQVVSAGRTVAATQEQRAQVRWTGDEGTTRTDNARVKPHTPEGATVRLWVTRGGAVTGPPMTENQAVTTSWFTGGAAAAGFAAIIYVTRVGVRHELARKRYAQWDAEWERVEPLWADRFRR
ncbi:Rv1733c family protein [Streptomyces werraensis]|uniref:Rv1733c family protein n=1 Tax=Streptomyces werraensis TaxID=68284 RepID=UPI003692B6FD